MNGIILIQYSIGPIYVNDFISFGNSLAKGNLIQCIFVRITHSCFHPLHANCNCLLATSLKAYVHP